MNMNRGQQGQTKVGLAVDVAVLGATNLKGEKE